MDSGKVVIALLAGVAAGAVLGVLFAPEKGTVIRKKISRTGEDFKKSAKEKFDEFLDDISEKYDHVVEEVSDFVDHSDTEKKGSDKKAKTVAD